MTADSAGGGGAGFQPVAERGQVEDLSHATVAEAPRVFSGLRVVSLFTLLSRVLGLVRDVGMAALFGNGAVLDAFSVAFRVPNLSRRLFGEGALTAAFLPVFVREMEHEGRESAWKLASAVFTALAVALVVLVLLGELALWGASVLWGSSPEAGLLISLTALMLPYLILICLAAQVSAVLHALGHFTWPALLPVLLNLVWLAGLWWVAPQFDSKTAQIYVVSACVLVGGCLQLAAPLPTLFRLRRDRSARTTHHSPFTSHHRVREIARAMLPILVGLSVTQINTLADSLIAWGFSQPAAGPERMSLPGEPAWPMQTGTASALYFGQRMYQFPLGVFGVALGTVLFPLLSRHAGRGRLDLLRDDLSLGLRLVIAVGLPASVGLVLLAEPLTALLFQHGEFDAEDARQTAAMIAAYGVGVWAYSGLLIIHRGYYAIGDRQTPLRIGLVAVALNLVLNFTLIWPLGGEGLALATSVSAIVQVAAATWFIQARIGRVGWGGLTGSFARAAAATGIMAAVCLLALAALEPSGSLSGRAIRVIVPVTCAILTYFAAAKVLKLDEVWLLFRRERSD